MKICDLPRRGAWGDREVHPPTSALWTHLPSLRSLSLALELELFPPFVLEKLAVSQLENLALRGCHFYPPDLSATLKCMPTLKSFEFQRPDESGELIETLKEHCGRSLESLALKSLFHIGKKPVTALHEFQTLRKLTIFEDTFIDDDTDEFEKLVNVLPPTIEVVTLLILDWKSGIQVLRDMPSRAGTTVPNLHTLRVGLTLGNAAADMVRQDLANHCAWSQPLRQALLEIARSTKIKIFMISALKELA